MIIPKPFVSLSIAGVPSDLALGTGLISFSYRDVHGGAVDEVSFTVADPKGLWRSGWFLDDSMPVSASIGYDIGAQVACGGYELEESEGALGADGDTMTFRAIAAFTSKDLRSERSVAYDEMTLKDVVAKIAGRHGLKTLIDVPDLKFARLSQSKQSDLEFLTRLADDWGCYFSIKGALLVFLAREVVEASAPVKLLNLLEGERTKSARLRKASHGCFAKAELAYLNPKTGKTIKVTKTDARVKNSDTLKLDDKVESLAQAERLCASKLAAANDGVFTGEIAMPGNPLMLAGQVVALGPAYGKYAGRWLVTESQHSFDGSGYETSLTIKGIA